MHAFACTHRRTYYRACPHATLVTMTLWGKRQAQQQEASTRLPVADIEVFAIILAACAAFSRLWDSHLCKLCKATSRPGQRPVNQPDQALFRAEPAVCMAWSPW